MTTGTSPKVVHERLVVDRASTAKAYLSQHVQVISIAIVLVVLVTFFSATADNFFSFNNLVNVAVQISPTLIVATAMTFVITSAGIDLAVGSTIAVTGAGLAFLLDLGWNTTLAFIAVLVCGAAIGSVNGYFSLYQRLQPFIVTLATLSVLSGLALLLTGGYSIPISPTAWVTQLGQGKVGPIPIPVIVAAAVALLGWLVLEKTPFGRYVVALGSNSESLRRSGVNMRRVGFYVYVLSGVASALAGMIIASRLGSGSSNAGGTTFGLAVITAVVLGGTDLFGGRGSIVGTVLGALALGVIENGLVLSHVSTFYVPIVQGTILLVAILLNTRAFSRFMVFR